MDWLGRIMEAGVLREDMAHPHVEAERAHLFTSTDGGSSEIETLELLHALVRWTKPAFALETGTFRGFGSVAIAAAMQRNGNGVLHSIEREKACISEAASWLRLLEIRPRVEFHQCDSLDWLSRTDKVFDFAFLDSDLSVRGEEARLMVDRGLLSFGALVLVHDTSPLRLGGDNVAMNAALEEILGRGIRLPWSRGLRLFQVGG